MCAAVALALLGGCGSPAAHEPLEDRPQSPVEEVDAVASPEEVSFRRGETTRTFVGDRVDPGAHVVWSSGETTDEAIVLTTSAPEVVAVDGDTLLGVSRGVATITGTYEDLSATIRVEVFLPTPERVVINDGRLLVVELGGELELALFGASGTGEPFAPVDVPVTWSSDDPTIAEVNGGVLHGLQLGTTSVEGRFEGRSTSQAVEVVLTGQLNDTSYPGPCQKLGWRDGEVIATEDYTYDANNLPVAMDYFAERPFSSAPHQRRETMAYDAQSRLIRRTRDFDADGTIEQTHDWVFDSQGRVERHRETALNGHYTESVHSYDAQDRVIEIVHSGSMRGLITTTTYVYATDGLSARAEQVDADGVLESAWNLHWNADGELVRYHFEEVSFAGEEFFRDYTYDERSNLIEMWVWHPFSLDPSQYVTLQRYEYHWDLADNPLREEQVTASAGFGDVTRLWTYAYDCWMP